MSEARGTSRNSIPVLACSAMLLSLFSSALLAEPIIYATERGPEPGVSTGDLYAIDLGGRPVATRVYDGPPSPAGQNQYNSAAYDRFNDRLYFSNTDGDSRPSQIGFFEGGSFTFVEQLRLSAEGADFYDGSYWFIGNGSDRLVQVELDFDGTFLGSITTPLGRRLGYRFGDVAISCDGVLYGSAEVNDGFSVLGVEFFSIDLENGFQWTTIASGPVDDGVLQLAFGDNGVLYATRADTGEFFTVDTASGGLTSIGFATGSTTNQFTDLASNQSCELPPEEVTPAIDINPGKEPGCFELDGKGYIRAAILGGEEFDVSDVDPSTLALGGMPVKSRRDGMPYCDFEDASGDFVAYPEGGPDGYIDLKCKYENAPDLWSPLDEERVLITGSLFDGTPLIGEGVYCLKDDCDCSCDDDDDDDRDGHGKKDKDEKYKKKDKKDKHDKKDRDSKKDKKGKDSKKDKKDKHDKDSKQGEDDDKKQKRGG